MDTNDNKKSQDAPQSQSRRDALKALATIPVVGAFGYGVYKKIDRDNEFKRKSSFLKFNTDPIIPPDMSGQKIRIGLIGFGIRGKQLMQALGFAEPKYIDTLIEQRRKDSNDTRYEVFMEQDDLNIEITAVCDVFDEYGEAAIQAGANIYREGTGGKLGKTPVRYRTYKELLAADNVDAVIIASPDHWHVTMAQDAALAGKHVYVEKPLSWTVPETYRIRQTIRDTGMVLQLGHQGRQTDSYVRAKEIIDRGMLGKVNLIEVCTNRNTPNGAWVYPIIEGSSPQTIDYKQFEGPKAAIMEYENYMRSNNLQRYMGPEPRDQFSLERFFRWRCWWDYSTGLSGDLLTHEYDAINQIFGCGIPSSATSSGGVYVFNDGRTVPDVLQTAFEFKDKELTMLYSATLGNNRNRGKVFMGRDASLEVSSQLKMIATSQSTLYKEQIDAGVIRPGEVFYTYIPGSSLVDGLTSPTAAYFAERGLLYTYVSGRRYDTTHLHLREWLFCIRTGKTPSCNIDQAFEEAMTAHMGTRAYLEGRTMYWDKDKEEIVRG